MANASFSITNPKLSAALVAFQAEIGAVAKTSANPFFKSKYAALPDVVAHAQPLLAKHGLAVTQTIGFWNTGDSVLDTLTTMLVHESGESLQDTMRLHLPKDDPQGQGSAVTYARRYSYMSILGLVADEDDDGNAGSKPQARPAQASAPTGKASPEIQKIIDAAKADPDDEFLNSLAEQWVTKGKLSDKQIAAGARRAAGKQASNVVESAIAEEFGGYSGEPF